MIAIECKACGCEMNAYGQDEIACPVCGKIAPRPLTPAEKNAHYGRLNERFDARVKKIFALGFRNVRLEEYDVGVWVRTRPGSVKRESLASSFVMCADEVVWEDRMRDFQ